MKIGSARFESFRIQLEIGWSGLWFIRHEDGADREEAHRLRNDFFDVGLQQFYDICHFQDWENVWFVNLEEPIPIGDLIGQHLPPSHYETVLYEPAVLEQRACFFFSYNSHTQAAPAQHPLAGYVGKTRLKPVEQWRTPPFDPQASQR